MIDGHVSVTTGSYGPKLLSCSFTLIFSCPFSLFWSWERIHVPFINDARLVKQHAPLSKLNPPKK